MFIRFFIYLTGLVLLSVTGVQAQTTNQLNSVDKSPLNVAVKIAPPFVMTDENGGFRGISIALWEDIADNLELEFNYQEASTTPELIAGVESGQFDIAIAAITVTPARERRVDFTHPLYSTGLGIATSIKQESFLWGLTKRLFSWQFFSVIAGLTLLLLVIGMLMWLAERRRNPEQFGGNSRSGLASGFWWAAVTMTTVGYGDKAPITIWGRVLGLTWMFGAIIIISSFTAAMASALTVGQLEGTISGPSDLVTSKTASVRDSTAAEWLRDRAYLYNTYDSIEAAMTAAAKGEVDAVVHDRPLLRYWAQEKFSDQLLVIESEFQRQDYAFAVKQGSPLREALNISILELVPSERWQAIRESYMDVKQ